MGDEVLERVWFQHSHIATIFNLLLVVGIFRQLTRYETRGWK